ncbi:hypothetical protein [Lacrimispora sp.]
MPIAFLAIWENGIVQALRTSCKLLIGGAKAASEIIQIEWKI